MSGQLAVGATSPIASRLRLHCRSSEREMHGGVRWQTSFRWSAGASQPSSRESGAAQPIDDGRTLAHQPPYQPRPIVFNHQHNGPLIESIVAFGSPTAGAGRTNGESRIEAAPES